MEIPQIDLHIQHNPYQNPRRLFCRYQPVPKIHKEVRESQMSPKRSWKRRTKLEDSHFPIYFTYYITTKFKTRWYRQKDRHVAQWNRSENQEINSHIYGQLIFNKDAKTIQWGKNSLQQMAVDQLESHTQKNEVVLLPHIIHKKQLKTE